MFVCISSFCCVGKEMERCSQISSACAAPSYATGKQTEADCLFRWLPVIVLQQRGRSVDQDSVTKDLEPPLCVLCSWMWVAVTAHWCKCLGALAGSTKLQKAREKKLSHQRVFFFFKAGTTLEQTCSQTHNPCCPQRKEKLSFCSKSSVSCSPSTFSILCAPFFQLHCLCVTASLCWGPWWLSRRVVWFQSAYCCAVSTWSWIMLLRVTTCWCSGVAKIRLTSWSLPACHGRPLNATRQTELWTLAHPSSTPKDCITQACSAWELQAGSLEVGWLEQLWNNELWHEELLFMYPHY